MDFDEFEKQQEAKEARHTTAGFYGGNHSWDHTPVRDVRKITGTGSGGILDQFEEWEDYMQFGGAGRRVGGFRVDM